MKNSSIKKFIALRDGLLKEKAELTARLAEIEKALGVEGEAKTEKTAKAPKAAGTRGPKRRARNELSLKEAALKVAVKPLTKQEILDGILKLGYVFKTKDPMNSLNVVLYSGKNFKRADGKFVAAK